MSRRLSSKRGRTSQPLAWLRWSGSGRRQKPLKKRMEKRVVEEMSPQAVDNLLKRAPLQKPFKPDLAGPREIA